MKLRRIPTGHKRTRIRPFATADAFMNALSPQVHHTTPTRVLEHNAQLIATFDLRDQCWNVQRDRNGWWPSPTTGPPNTTEISYLAIATGTPVANARSVIHAARLRAMELGFEWVICTLEGPQWAQIAARDRWRDDQNPLLWLFWIEGFVDIANPNNINMIWRNPAF